MRDDFCNSYTIGVRDKFSQIRKLTTMSVVLMGFMSFGYFFFWLGSISDEIFYEYGRQIFEPLAMLLNLGDTSIGIYLNTSLILLGAIIPILIGQYFMDKMEEALIKSHNIKQEKKRQKEQKEEYKSYMSRFDSIKTYSICLSIDYESEKEISYQSKTLMNKAIYSKIATILNKIEPYSKTMQNDVLIFTSHNFSNYDYIYDCILNGLSQIKNGIEKKYKYKLIPSITTDAFSSNPIDANIRKQHFEIQSFNFKNRALSTATFANKYKHLRHKKYAGIPIGEYAYFGNEKMGTYELNVIHKNLAQTLS